MFGQFYQRRDVEVAHQDGRLLTRGAYARELLAGLLNRAAALEAARRLYSQADELDQGAQAREVFRAVEVFLEDLEEVRTRGLRARLFSRNEWGTLSTDSVAAEDTLEDLGGELVRAERAINSED